MTRLGLLGRRADDGQPRHYAGGRANWLQPGLRAALQTDIISLTSNNSGSSWQEHSRNAEAAVSSEFFEKLASSCALAGQTQLVNVAQMATKPLFRDPARLNPCSVYVIEPLTLKAQRPT
jgi:hypothetical protein